MLEVEVFGSVSEFLYKGVKSSKFVIEESGQKLVGTITLRNIDLVEQLNIGESYIFKGMISDYVKETANGIRHDNVFYVNAVEQLKTTEGVQ